jgi:hypothetical protein
MVPSSGIAWEGATELADTVLVHRAVLSQRYLKGDLRAAVFLRREKDVEGLSVTNAHICTGSEVCEFFRVEYDQDCFGVALLQVGDIRGLGFDVRPDEEHLPEHVCDHGFITGLPFKERERLLAESIATQLKNIVRDVWRAATVD